MLRVDNAGKYDAAAWDPEKKKRCGSEGAVFYDRSRWRLRECVEFQQTEDDPLRPDAYTSLQHANYVCTDCGKGYKWLDSLKRHKRVDCGNKEKRFSCHMCNKKFKYRYELKNHITAHHGMNIVQCGSDVGS
ncbi:zinc finger E-box-binding homeobox 1-like [Augochlora pura]